MNFLAAIYNTLFGLRQLVEWLEVSIFGSCRQCGWVVMRFVGIWGEFGLVFWWCVMVGMIWVVALQWEAARDWMDFLGCCRLGRVGVLFLEIGRALRQFG